MHLLPLVSPEVEVTKYPWIPGFAASACPLPRSRQESTPAPVLGNFAAQRKERKNRGSDKLLQWGCWAIFCLSKSNVFTWVFTYHWPLVTTPGGNACDWWMLMWTLLKWVPFSDSKFASVNTEFSSSITTGPKEARERSWWRSKKWRGRGHVVAHACYPL